MPQRLGASALWRRSSRNESFHGYGAKPSVMLDHSGSQHLRPHSWRRQQLPQPPPQEAAPTDVAVVSSKGDAVSAETPPPARPPQLLGDINKPAVGEPLSAAAAAELPPAEPLRPVEEVTGAESAEAPPETPRRPEMHVRGAVQLGQPSAAAVGSAEAELRSELLDKGLSSFQARPLDHALRAIQAVHKFTFHFSLDALRSGQPYCIVISTKHTQCCMGHL